MRLNRAATPIRGVYAITPDESNTDLLCAQVGEALAGGVRLVQYRNKAANVELAHEQALALRRLTSAAGARLIVNDNVELALAVRADGVHLGRDDFPEKMTPADFSSIRRKATSIMPATAFLLGVSCYDQMPLAQRASVAGADYIAFGAFFSSTTKPHAVRAGLSLIAEARQAFTQPVVAIGGITTENAPQLVAAGVDAIAVISSLFCGELAEIGGRARALTSIFDRHV
jgi:thiamine-phosphate pyrophosphorylase